MVCRVTLDSQELLVHQVTLDSAELVNLVSQVTQDCQAIQASQDYQVIVDSLEVVYQAIQDSQERQVYQDIQDSVDYQVIQAFQD